VNKTHIQSAVWIGYPARMSHASALSDADASGRESFTRRGYAMIPALLQPALTDFFWSYAHTKQACGLMTPGDRLVPGAPTSYADPAVEALLPYIRKRIEAITGRALLPTYSYFRIYQNGDDLKIHRDRPACEFSLSLNIGQTPQEPWPIFIESPGGAARADLRPGDALLYRGIDLFHWRERYQGRQLVQFFLHYVDANGPHAGERFDGRPALMLQKSAPA
jgi:hypothetical protein